MVERIRLSPTLPEPIEGPATRAGPRPRFSLFVSRQLGAGVSPPSFASQAIREYLSADVPQFVEISGTELELAAGLDLEAANALAQAKSAVMGIVGGARDLEEARAEVFGSTEPLTPSRIAWTAGARVLGVLGLGSSTVGEAASYITEELRKPITEKELEEPGYMQIPRALGTALKALPIGVGRAIAKWWEGEDYTTPSQAITEAIRLNTSAKDFRLPTGVGTLYDIASDPLNLVGFGSTTSGRLILKRAASFRMVGDEGQRALWRILLYHGDDEARLFEKAGTLAYRQMLTENLTETALKIDKLRETFTERLMRIYPGLDEESARQIAKESIRGSIANQAAPTLAEALMAYGWSGVKEALETSGDQTLIGLWKNFEASLPEKIVSRGAHTLQGGIRFAGKTLVPATRLRPASEAWQNLSRSLPVLSSVMSLKRKIHQRLSPAFRAAEWFREHDMPVDIVLIEHLFDAERFGRIQGKKFLDEAAAALEETGWTKLSKESRERIYQATANLEERPDQAAVRNFFRSIHLLPPEERADLLDRVGQFLSRASRDPEIGRNPDELPDVLGFKSGVEAKQGPLYSALAPVLRQGALRNELLDFFTEVGVDPGRLTPEELERHIVAFYVAKVIPALSSEEAQVSQAMEKFFAKIPDIAAKYGVEIPIRGDYGWPRALSDVRKRAMETTEEYAALRRRTIGELLTRRPRRWEGPLPPDIFEQDPDRLLRAYLMKVRQDIQSVNFGQEAMRLPGLHGIPVALQIDGWIQQSLTPVLKQWVGYMQENTNLLRQEIHDLTEQLRQKVAERDRLLPYAPRRTPERKQVEALNKEISQVVQGISEKASRLADDVSHVLSLNSEAIDTSKAIEAEEAIKLWDKLEEIATWSQQKIVPDPNEIDDTLSRIDDFAERLGEIGTKRISQADREPHLYEELSQSVGRFFDARARRAVAVATEEAGLDDARRIEEYKEFLKEVAEYTKGNQVAVGTALAKAGYRPEDLLNPRTLHGIYAQHIRDLARSIRDHAINTLKIDPADGSVARFEESAKKLVSSLERGIVADLGSAQELAQAKRDFHEALGELANRLAKLRSMRQVTEWAKTDMARKLATDLARAIDLGYYHSIVSFSKLVASKGIDGLLLFDQLVDDNLHLGLKLPEQLRGLVEADYPRLSRWASKVIEEKPVSSPEPFSVASPVELQITDDVIQRRELLRNTVRAISYIAGTADQVPTDSFLNSARQVARATEGLRRAERRLQAILAPVSGKASRDATEEAAAEIVASLLELESRTQVLSTLGGLADAIGQAIDDISRGPLREGAPLAGRRPEQILGIAGEPSSIIDPAISAIGSLPTEVVQRLNATLARIPYDASSMAAAWRELAYLERTLAQANLERALGQTPEAAAAETDALLRRYQGAYIFWHTTLTRITSALFSQLRKPESRALIDSVIEVLKRTRPQLADDISLYLKDAVPIVSEVNLGGHKVDLLAEIALVAGREGAGISPDDYFRKVGMIMDSLMGALASPEIHTEWMRYLGRSIGKPYSKMNKTERAQLLVAKTAQLSQVFEEVFSHFVPGHWAATSVDEAAQAMSLSRSLAGMVHASVVPDPGQLTSSLLRLGFPERSVVDGYLSYFARAVLVDHLARNLEDFAALEQATEATRNIAQLADQIGQKIKTYEDYIAAISRRMGDLGDSEEADKLVSDRLQALAASMGYHSADHALARLLSDPEISDALISIMRRAKLGREARVLSEMMERTERAVFAKKRQEATAAARLLRTWAPHKEVYSATEQYQALSWLFSQLADAHLPHESLSERSLLADRMVDVLNTMVLYGVRGLEDLEPEFLRAHGRTLADMFRGYTEGEPLDLRRAFSQFLDRIGFARALDNTSRLGYLRPLGETEGLPVPSEWQHVIMPAFATQVLRDLYEPMQITQTVLDKTMQAWKLGKIGFRPGFHIRNFISNIWLLSASGWYSNPLELAADITAVMRGRLSQKEIQVAVDAALLRHTATPGSLRNLKLWQTPWGTFGLEDLMGGILEDQGVLSKLGRPGIATSNIVENIARLALAKRIIREYGKKLPERELVQVVAREVSRVLFDYSFLTKTERQIRRYISPFYTWLRNNLGFQLYLFSRRPVAYFNLMTAPTAITAEADERLGRQPYEALPIRIGDRLFYLDLPTLDFLRASQMVSGLTGYLPVAPLKGGDRSEVARWAGQVLGGPVVAAAQWITGYNLYAARRLEADEMRKFLIRQLAPEGGTLVSLSEGGSAHWTWLFGVRTETIDSAKRREAFRRLSRAKTAAEEARARGSYISPPPGETYYKRVVPAEVEWYGLTQKLLRRPALKAIDRWGERLVAQALVGQQARPPRMRPLREGEITERIIERGLAEEFDLYPGVYKF